MERERRRSLKGAAENEEEALINAEMVDHFTEAVLENAFVTTLFGIHRDHAINRLVGLRDEAELIKVKEEKDEDEEGATGAEDGPKTARNAAAGHGPVKRNNWRNRAADLKCKCYVCGQMIAAVRFAPHLEKCIGIGRAARSRRRGGGACSTSDSGARGLDTVPASGSLARSTRSSTLRSATRLSTAVPRRAAVHQQDFSLPRAVEDGGGDDHPMKGEGAEAEEEEEPLRDRLRNKTGGGRTMK